MLAMILWKTSGAVLSSCSSEGLRKLKRTINILPISIERNIAGFLQNQSRLVSHKTKHLPVLSSVVPRTQE